MGNAWPPRTFHFAVQFQDDSPAYFREVTGLEAEPTEYRRDHGSHPIRMPNRPRFGSLTLHRGLLASDSKLLKWCEQAQWHAVDHRTVTVQLMNESGAVTTVWTLINAWPTRLVSVIGNPESETAVDAIELAFESLTVSQR